MWWIAPVVVVGAGGAVAGAALVGAAAAVWALFSEDEREARERWARDHNRVQRSVAEHRRNIEANLARAQASYDFQVLSDMHWSSQQLGNHAHALQRDANKSLRGMGKVLVEAKRRRTELRQRQKGTKGQVRRDLQAEVDMLNGLRAEVFPDKDTVKAQRDDLRAEMRRLNAQTRELKLAIRDRCGERGRDWYCRLEQRTAERRRRQGR